MQTKADSDRTEYFTCISGFDFQHHGLDSITLQSNGNLKSTIASYCNKIWKVTKVIYVITFTFTMEVLGVRASATGVPFHSMVTLFAFTWLGLL